MKMLLGALIGVLVFAKIFGGSDDSTVPSTVELPTSSTVQKIEPVKETCADLEKIFGESSTKTEIQKEEIWKKFQDREFEWALVVAEIGISIGEPYVEFICNSGNGKKSKVSIYYSNEDKKDLLEIKKGNQYRVRGILRGYGGVFSYALIALPVPGSKLERITPISKDKTKNAKVAPWWIFRIDANGAMCLPAVGVLAPDTVIKNNPDCFKDRKPSDAKGLLVLNCLKAVNLRTQLAYTDSQERCSQIQNSLQESGAMDEEIQKHRNRQGADYL